jgi:hypothetical protein
MISRGGSPDSSVRTGTTSRDRARARRAVKHGVDLNKLQGWAANQYQEQLNNEESRQEIAIQKMKKQVISNGAYISIISSHHMLIKYCSHDCSLAVLVSNAQTQFCI